MFFQANSFNRFPQWPALIGSLGAFDPSLETFTAYLERLQQIYIANDIRQCPADATETVKKAADTKKVAVIISVIGGKTYNFLRDLCSPFVPKEKSFSEICELLKSHYQPKNLEVVGESQLFQTNPIHVVKATPPNNHEENSERRDTHRSKRQFSSKSTEDKKPFYTCFSCGENWPFKKTLQAQGQGISLV